MVLHLGCGQPPSTSAGSGAKARPATVAESVAELQQLRDQIKAAFDAGTPHDCDGALHDAADILSALPKLALDEGALDEGAMETLKTASTTLFDQLMKIHEGFHGPTAADDGSDENVYEQLSEDINGALDQLASVAGQNPATE